MNRSAIALASSLLIGLVLAPAAMAQSASPAITEEAARAIAADAYVYFYPLVTMDVTRKQLTNKVPGPGDFGGPMNTFVNVAAFPPADFKDVVRPNFDTLYSSAYLDLTKEPMVVSVPDTGGRYYLLHARHVDGCLCVAGLADDGHQGGKIPRSAARLERNGSGGIYPHQRAHALRLDHRPHQDRRPGGLRCGA